VLAPVLGIKPPDATIPTVDFRSLGDAAKAPLRPAGSSGFRAKSACCGKTRVVTTVGTSTSLADKPACTRADFNVIGILEPLNS
jgi:hypothetical protein